VPDVKALERVLAKLKQHQIQHFVWTEPDYNFGMTAITTVPLNEQQKQCLLKYQLLKYAGVDGRLSSGKNRDSRTNASQIDSAMNGSCLQ
jgi:hypothetical protein